MAVVGQVLENPASGEPITFRTTAAMTNGELVAMDLELPRGRRVPGGLHVHPLQEERFEDVRGTMRFRLRQQRIVAGARDVVVVPSGVPHDFANAGDETAIVRVEIRPALKMEHLLSRGPLPGRADHRPVPWPAAHQLELLPMNLETEALVPSDVALEVGLEVAGDTVAIGGAEHGLEQPPADALAASALVDPDHLEVPVAAGGEGPFDVGAEARQGGEGSWCRDEHAQQERQGRELAASSERIAPGRKPDGDADEPISVDCPTDVPVPKTVGDGEREEGRERTRAPLGIREDVRERGAAVKRARQDGARLDHAIRRKPVDTERSALGRIAHWPFWILPAESASHRWP
jgi:quercetin dioxygenase-like cupin family protein